jgi:hypothetical protein
LDIYYNSEVMSNPEEYNSKKRKILGDGIFESFMHPKKFKTGKIEFKSEPKSEPKGKKESTSKTLSDSKLSKHKFNII